MGIKGEENSEYKNSRYKEQLLYWRLLQGTQALLPPGAEVQTFVRDSIATAHGMAERCWQSLLKSTLYCRGPQPFWHSTKDQFRGRQFFHGHGSWDGSGGTVSNGSHGEGIWSLACWPAARLLMCGGFVANRPPRGLGTPALECRENCSWRGSCWPLRI